jgi:DNA ligase-4
MGLSEKSVLKYYHPDAVDYFCVTSNLRQLCTVLKDPAVRISTEVSLEPHILTKKKNATLWNPIKPMLGSRHLPEQVVKIMEGKEFVIETKFDGERIQVHKDGDTVRLFTRYRNHPFLTKSQHLHFHLAAFGQNNNNNSSSSQFTSHVFLQKHLVFLRNSNEVTSLYGDKLIPVILSTVQVSRCILDGELVVWDSISERFEDFGKLKTFGNCFEVFSSLLLVSFFSFVLLLTTKAKYDDGKRVADLGSNLGKQLCCILSHFNYFLTAIRQRPLSKNSIFIFVSVGLPGFPSSP